ncbi:MAG: signal peptide peptidase SppA [Gammaproteobacteria bacterium]|nr:signal peptide peptidase SppA [Gammaproteobacteria bacterium]
MSGSNPIARVFGFIWRLIERLVKGIQILVFLFIVVLVLSALSGLSGGGITVPDSGAMVLAPSGYLVEQPEGEPLDRALLEMEGGQSQTIVREVTKSLEFAADDDRIKAVVLLPGYLQGGGLSKQQEIAAALDKFRASGKRVIAMSDSYDQSQYYLAAHADEIYMHDFGFVLIEGFGYFKTYFAEALKNLQVDVNVFRVGEYKSFVEPYLRNDMSDEDKRVAERWLQGLWSVWERDVAAARGIEPQLLDRYINDVVSILEESDGDAGKAAVDAGLVDGLMSHQEFRKYMIDYVGVSADEADTFEQIDYHKYLIAVELENGTDEVQSAPTVAVIVASGEIIDGEAPPGTIGSVTLTRLIRQVTNDDSVAAVVLRVDSPGGSMFASEVVLDQLQELKATGRPLVVSMGSVAASGGYYISMDADEIWAAETTISGSIGVGAIFPTFQRSLNKLGLTVDGFGTTNLSGQLSAVRPLGDDARELLDVSVRSAYDVFIGKVAAARDIDIKRVDEIAQGRVWIGEDAYQIGLVDELGGVAAAIDSAATLAGLTEGEYKTVYVERELTVSEKVLLQYARLLGMLFATSYNPTGGISTMLQRLAGSIESELALLKTWNDPRGIYYHCMCEMR